MLLVVLVVVLLDVALAVMAHHQIVEVVTLIAAMVVASEVDVAAVASEVDVAAVMIATATTIADLGSAVQIGLGGSSVVDLIDSRGSAFSATGLSGTSFQGLLNTALGSSVPDGAAMTLAGGANGSATFFYLSANRGLAGSDPTLPLSTAPVAWTHNQQASIGGFPAGVRNGNSINGRGLNASVSIGTGASPNTSSFSYAILGVNNGATAVSSFQSQLPDTTISGGKAFEDVWFDASASGTSLNGWVYEGYLTLDLTGDTTDLLTFTPASVPEPSSFSLLAGLGLLAVAVRRQWAKA